MDARFAAYLGVAALLIMTPGPDMALVTKNALLAGVQAARWTGLGVGLGSVAWAPASVLGIGLLLGQSVFAFTAVKLVCAGYLTTLGIIETKSADARLRWSYRLCDTGVHKT